MAFSQIKLNIDGRIAVLTLDRPDIKNVITGQDMIDEILAALAMINENKSISVLVLKSSGEVFSAGGDVKSMDKKSDMFSGEHFELFDNYQGKIQKLPRAFFDLEVPSIASVNGPATGAGCDLALMCDMRIASTEAWFSESFINLGLISGDGGLFFLPRLVNYGILAEMVFTGAKISAKRAYEVGLVNYLVPSSELDMKSMEIASKIAKKPPVSVRAACRLMKTIYGESLDQVLYSSALVQSLCHSTKDHSEAVRAFLDKRRPEFNGK